mmetsp:Transcript_39441/g.85078  ORF Transcript_39441/g.85078 Transcript_39441/m.85078 type:complete len:146 (+) Transcript_39441:64-501(+)
MAAKLAKELGAKANLEDEEMLRMNKALMDLIMDGDFESYKVMCDEQLTCYEPEAKGHLLKGLDFHKYYFDLMQGQSDSAGKKEVRQTTMVAPNITWMCNRQAAIVCFKRLVQAGVNTIVTEESRVWEFVGSRWKLRHFHRSPGAS